MGPATRDFGLQVDEVFFLRQIHIWISNLAGLERRALLCVEAAVHAEQCFALRFSWKASFRFRACTGTMKLNVKWGRERGTTALIQAFSPKEKENRSPLL